MSKPKNEVVHMDNGFAVSWALSDQEISALIAPAVSSCRHAWGRWFTNQHIISRFLPRVVYAFPGRETRICRKCGWREHRNAEGYHEK